MLGNGVMGKGQTPGRAPLAPSERGRLRDAVLDHLDRHPRPDEIFFFSDEQPFTPRQLRDEVANGTALGERQLDAMQLVAEGVGGLDGLIERLREAQLIAGVR